MCHPCAGYVEKDKVGQAIHWKLCQKFSLLFKDKWYDHAPEGVMEMIKCRYYGTSGSKQIITLNTIDPTL